MERQNEIFINNMKHYLNMTGKSQKIVADAIGVPVSTFSTWMVGKALPRMGKLQALADYFGCSITDLLEERKLENDIIFNLSDDEQLLIEAFRSKDNTYRKMIEMIIFNYKQSQEGDHHGNS